jgi:hypothetical protein
VILVALIGIYVSIDMIARNIVDSQGTAVLGVQTSVSSIRLGVFRSESSLSNLTIANPEGFQKPDFIKIDEARLQVSIGTLLSSDIEIPLVTITGLTVDLEQIDDRMNASIIVKNVDANTATPDDTDDPMKFNIKKLVIEDITLTASGSIVNIAGGKLDTKIPRLELNNLGTETDGDQLSHQLVSMMLGVLMKHIAANPVEGLSSVAVGTLLTAVENIPLIGSSGVSKKLGDVLKGAGADLGEGVKGLEKGLEKGLKGVGQGIGDLIGGSGKKEEDSGAGGDGK